MSLVLSSCASAETGSSSDSGLVAGVATGEQIGPQVAPVDAIVVNGAGAAGPVLVAAVEWPNETNDAVVGSYLDETEVDWPEPVDLIGGDVLRIATPELPELVEYWFYEERLSSGVPSGDPATAGLCVPNLEPGCAVSVVEAQMVEVALPEIHADGLLVVQVEWRTRPSLSDSPLVARVSWAIELRNTEGHS